MSEKWRQTQDSSIHIIHIHYSHFTEMFRQGICRNISDNLPQPNEYSSII